jgi:hypothetical protein
MGHMLSTTQLFDLLLRRILIAIFPYARIVELKKKAESWGMRERLAVFLPFVGVGVIAAIADQNVLLCICGAASVVVTFFTTACDDLGRKLTRKFHNFLRSLNTLVTKLVQPIKSFKAHFQSAILPIVLPPPRAHLAR